MDSCVHKNDQEVDLYEAVIGSKIFRRRNARFFYKKLVLRWPKF